MSYRHLLRVAFVVALATGSATAVTTYNIGSHGIDEPATDAQARALMRNDAAAAGFSYFVEDFSSSPWDTVRTTISGGTFDEPAIASQGVTWSTSAGDEITTYNDGTAGSPSYKIFSIGHGPNENLHAVPDVLIGQATQTLYGLGFLITGNKGKIHVILDDDETNFIKFVRIIDIIPGTGGDEPEVVKQTLTLTNGWAYVGFIAPQGFHKFEIREIDGVLEDQALMWAKDFDLLTLLGPAALLGDANNDGVVSADDFAAVQAHFGNTGAADGLLPGDANDDGVVSADDFAAIQASFGNVLSASATVGSVPEPAGMGLLACGILGLCRRR